MKFKIEIFANYETMVEFLNKLSYDQQKHAKIISSQNTVSLVYPLFCEWNDNDEVIDISRNSINPLKELVKELIFAWDDNDDIAEIIEKLKKKVY